MKYDPETQYYELRYFNAPETYDGEDVESATLDQVRQHIKEYEDDHESEEEEESYTPTEDVPDSPLRVDTVGGGSAYLSTNRIEPDDTENEDGQLLEEERDHEMEEEEGDLEEGVGDWEENTREGRDGDKRSVHPHWGSGGRYGNAQFKRFSKVEINHQPEEARVKPIHSQWCTDIVQIYSPSTKFFCNKPASKGFFKVLWKLPLLLLGVMSAFTMAILNVVQSGTKEATTNSDLVERIKKLVQALEDYSSRVEDSTEVYARLEFTIAIDHETIEKEAPPLPIIGDTCPLPAMEIVGAVAFKKSFTTFVSHITTPLRYISQSVHHFRDCTKWLSPEGKAALMCVMEMGVNTLGGGGCGKATALGNLLGSQKGTGKYSENYLGPLATDLTKLSKKDYAMSHLSFGLSDTLVGFRVGVPQGETEEDETTFTVTSNRSTEVLLSKTLKCPSAFLDCMQRVLVHMTGDNRSANNVTNNDRGISLLQPLKFVRLENYDTVQVTAVIRAIADQIVKLYRQEWAAILGTLFVKPPFTLVHFGNSTRVRTKADLERILATLRSIADMDNLWQPLACHRKGVRAKNQDMTMIEKRGK